MNKRRKVSALDNRGHQSVHRQGSLTTPCVESQPVGDSSRSEQSRRVPQPSATSPQPQPSAQTREEKGREASATFCGNAPPPPSTGLRPYRRCRLKAKGSFFDRFPPSESEVRPSLRTTTSGVYTLSQCVIFQSSITRFQDTSGGQAESDVQC